MSYVCPVCDRGFGSAPAIRSHSRATGHAIAECEQCDRFFVNENALTNHLENAAAHRYTYCSPCERNFRSSEAYQQHLANSSAHQCESSSSDDYSGDYSDGCSDESDVDECSDESDVDECSDESDEDEETFCSPCNRNFVDNDALNQHLANNGAHNWCFVCSRDFSSPQALSQHNASAAHKGRTYKCPFCTGMFKTPSSIAMHIESGCHKITRHQVTAAVHKLKIIPQISVSHRIEGPARAPKTKLITYSANEQAFNGRGYECYLCHRTFNTLDRLNQHLRSPAHDQMEFKCPNCRSEFSLISGLVQHIESESCGIARFKEVTDHFENLTARFSKLLKF